MRARRCRPRWAHVGVAALVGAFGCAVPMASGASAGASAPKLDTFVLSGGLSGTLKLIPTSGQGCQTPGFLSNLRGRVSGVKLRPGAWELAINDTRVGTFKASDSIDSRAHVTLQPPTTNTIGNTLTNVGGALRVTGAAGAAGSIDLQMSNVTGTLTTTITGRWRCPPGT